jgi:sensor histidine kinase YesM
MSCKVAPPNHSANHHDAVAVTSGIFKAIWMAPIIALILALLFLSIGKMHLSALGKEFLDALIYSICIGLPCGATLTWISVRYNNRFPRLVYGMRTLALLITATAGSMLAGVVFQIARIMPHGFYWVEFRASLPICVTITLIVGTLAASFETMRYQLQETTLELRNRQIEQERAYKLLAEAQLSSLESRIHPHFLFNTLNSIAALIPTDPQHAEDTVAKLASLLRFSLTAHNKGLVPLGQEIKIVRDYLEIEKTRFGSRLCFAIDVPDALADVSIPPLALQSLVENAVKHVVAQRQQGATIQVIAALFDHSIQLEVSDDGPGFSLASAAPEHGLGNLINRIELLFGSAGNLEVARANERTIVRLTFPA